MESVDLCLSPVGRIKSQLENRVLYFVPILAIIRLIRIMCIILEVTALLARATLELQDSARRKGRFALYNCLVLGHTKYSGV